MDTKKLQHLSRFGHFLYSTILKIFALFFNKLLLIRLIGKGFKNKGHATNWQQYKKAPWQEGTLHLGTIQISTSLAVFGAFAYRLQCRTACNAAPPAMPHHLQCRTACKIQNGCQGAPKWQTGSRFLGILSNFR